MRTAVNERPVKLENQLSLRLQQVRKRDSLQPKAANSN